jgi:ribosomal-protein-alanine N-acetyltransferase
MARCTINPMVEADLGDVAAIDAASFPAPLPAPGNQARDSAAQAREELARPWSRTWVARDEESRLVAFVLYWQVADELHVLNLATHPSQRRQGYARALMQHVIAIARASNIRHILLEVRRSNGPALALYRALGLTALGLRLRYYPDDEDAVEMILSFDPATGVPVPRRDDVRLD